MAIFWKYFSNNTKFYNIKNFSLLLKNKIIMNKTNKYFVFYYFKKIYAFKIKIFNNFQN